MSKTVTKYFHCATFKDLAKTITGHIFKALDYRLNEAMAHYHMGSIDFMVEETPGKDEWRKMTAKEKADAWHCAAGCYGIKEVGQMFGDPSNLLLVGGYYGCPHLVHTPIIDMDTTKGDLYAIVFSFLQDLLRYEDDPASRGNFIVKIDHEK